MPIKIFFSYAHEDAAYVDELVAHLSVLKRQGLIDTWRDRDIGAGTEWRQEIDKHLNTAQIILLLISQYFMASDYCYSNEMVQAMKRHDSGEARVIPVILRPVHWQGAPFGKLQALPTDGKPVTGSSWRSQDEAFFDVAEGIRKAVEKLTGSSYSAPLRVDRGTADRKIDEARKKVQEWGERMVGGQWDWHLLGQALQLAHEALENDGNYQRAWTLLADIYHRIGKTELALVCLKRSKALASPGPNFPGRFYKEVEYNITSGYPYNSAGGLQRQSPPQWFEEKYQRYWNVP